MTFFIDDVWVSSYADTTPKAQAIHKTARRFLDVAVTGDDSAPLQIASAIREKVKEIDAHFNEGEPTLINYSESRSGFFGEISAYPGSCNLKKGTNPYFTIYIHRVARLVTIPEAVALAKGGEL